MAPDPASALGPLWLFFHLPKTGGTTIDVHCARHLSMNRSFVTLSNWGDVALRRDGLPPFAQWDGGQRQSVRVITGHRTVFGLHRDFPGRPYRYVAILRDPADRILSRYNFNRSRNRTDLPFGPWYENEYLPHHRNAAVRFFADRLLPAPDGLERQYALATTLLDRCFFVGLTAHLNDDLPHLFRHMGLPTAWDDFRVTGSGASLQDVDHPARRERVHRYAHLDEPLRARIYEDNAAEVELVAYARERRVQTRPRLVET